MGDWGGVSEQFAMEVEGGGGYEMLPLHQIHRHLRIGARCRGRWVCWEGYARRCEARRGGGPLSGCVEGLLDSELLHNPIIKGNPFPPPPSLFDHAPQPRPPLLQRFSQRILKLVSLVRPGPMQEHPIRLTRTPEAPEVHLAAARGEGEPPLLMAVQREHCHLWQLGSAHKVEVGIS